MQNISLKSTTSGIYKITNTVNNKFYIGSSINIYYRIARHISDLNKNKHKNPILQNSYNKYKKESFKVEIIESCSNNLLSREQFYIDTMNPEFNVQRDVVYQFKTNDFKRNMSKIMKESYASGKSKPTRQRKLDVYDMNGIFIKTYEYRKDAIKDLQLSQTNLTRMLQGKILHCNGYQIFYKEMPYNVGKIICNKCNFRGEKHVNCTKYPCQN